MIVFDFAL